MLSKESSDCYYELCCFLVTGDYVGDFLIGVYRVGFFLKPCNWLGVKLRNMLGKGSYLVCVFCESMVAFSSLALFLFELVLLSASFSWDKSYL